MTGRKKSFLIAAAVLCVFSCNDALKIALDLKASTTPIVGGNGALTVSAVTMDGFTVSWAAAQEGVTPSEKMKYLVYTSTTNNISTVAEAEANGTPFGTMTENITSVAITGLDDNVEHWANVVVQDEAGNKAAYVMTPNSTRTVKHSRLFWCEGANRKIRWSELTGASPSAGFTTGTSSDPIGIAIDDTNRKIYFTDAVAHKISCVDIDGTNRRDLITANVSSPMGIALDSVNGKVYWTDYGLNLIYSAPIATNNGDALDYDIRSALSPVGIAVDPSPSTSKIYWIENGGGGKIMKANLDGTTGLATINDVDVVDPWALCLSADKASLYFAEWNPPVRIRQISTSGGVPTTLIGSGAVNPLGIAATSDYVYWTDIGSALLYRAPVSTLNGASGSFSLSINTNAGDPKGIAIY